jgi:hypothetical protein
MFLLHWFFDTDKKWQLKWFISFITFISSCMHECTTYYICWYSYLFKVSRLKKCLLTNDHREKYFSKQPSLLLLFSKAIEIWSFFLSLISYVGIKIKRHFFYFSLNDSVYIWYMIFNALKISKNIENNLFKIYLKRNSWILFFDDHYQYMIILPPLTYIFCLLFCNISIG